MICLSPKEKSARHAVRFFYPTNRSVRRMCFHLLQRLIVFDGVDLAWTLPAARCVRRGLHGGRGDAGGLARISLDQDQTAVAQIDRIGGRRSCGCCRTGRFSRLGWIAHHFGRLGLFHRVRISNVFGRLRTLNGGRGCACSHADGRCRRLLVRLNCSSFTRRGYRLLFTTLAFATSAATAAFATFAIAAAFLALLSSHCRLLCFQSRFLGRRGTRLALLLRLTLAAALLFFLVFGARCFLAFAALFAAFATLTAFAALFAAFATLTTLIAVATLPRRDAGSGVRPWLVPPAWPVRFRRPGT